MSPTADRAGVVLDFLRRVEPGAILVLGITALGFIINMSQEQAFQSTALALMQRDISSINTRMSSAEYTPAGAVSLELHREQIESIHRRVGDIEDETTRLWDRINNGR